MSDDPDKTRKHASGAADSTPTAHLVMQSEASDATSSAARDAPSNGHLQEKEPTKPSDQADRTGTDSRQRGWYWHWNGIITQYAPLIGLKGVGLLNSYTVWTDRREHSPYRGYAFPGQQSEANFYGEDRAELITINKILVALDLIEIRKEMVTKPDAQGRRWKVPHNFYRVKDRGDGMTLTTADVLRVVELATRDPAVYRYIRKIFWTRFEPIDRDNVWHTILREIASDPRWQRLAERARKQERKASERTKAGHRSRKRNESQDSRAAATAPQASPAEGSADDQKANHILLTSGQWNATVATNVEQSGPGSHPAQTIDAPTNRGSTTDVEAANTGIDADVAASNRGSRDERTSSDESANNGRASSVASSNTMYYQDHTTTTTTTTRRPRNTDAGVNRESETLVVANIGPAQDGHSSDPPTADDLEDPAPRPAADPASRREARRGDASPAAGQASGPVGDPSPLVVSLFEAANDRPATRLERILLSELERDADAAAQPNGSDGAGWVAAAIREAVASGSSFVAPKRIGEIIGRWAAEEDGPASQRERSGNRSLGAAPDSAANITKREREILAYIKRALDDQAFRRWFGAVQLAATTSSSLTLQAPDSAVEQKITADYLAIIERAAAEVYRRPMRIVITSPQPDAENSATDERTLAASTAQQSVVELRQEDLTSAQQLWNLTIEDLQGEIHHTTLDRIRNVVPLGVDPKGQILLGATGRLAERALSSSSDLISQSLAHILGRHHPIKVIPRDGWRVAGSGA